MKCPKCKKEITYVLLYNLCFRKATLLGNQIGAWERKVNVLDGTPSAIECSKCGEDIIKYIKE